MKKIILLVLLLFFTILVILFTFSFQQHVPKKTDRQPQDFSVANISYTEDRLSILKNNINTIYYNFKKLIGFVSVEEGTFHREGETAVSPSILLNNFAACTLLSNIDDQGVLVEVVLKSFADKKSLLVACGNSSNDILTIYIDSSTFFGQKPFLSKSTLSEADISGLDFVKSTEVGSILQANVNKPIWVNIFEKNNFIYAGSVVVMENE